MTPAEAQAAADAAAAHLARRREQLATVEREIAETDAELVAAGNDRSSHLQREAAGKTVEADLITVRRRLAEARERLEERHELLGVLTAQIRTAEQEAQRAADAVRQAQGEALLQQAREEADRANEIGQEYARALSTLWQTSEAARRLLGMQDGRPMWEDRYARGLSMHLLEARTLTVRFPAVVIG